MNRCRCSTDSSLELTARRLPVTVEPSPVAELRLYLVFPVTQIPRVELLNDELRSQRCDFIISKRAQSGVREGRQTFALLTDHVLFTFLSSRKPTNLECRR
jgi:hypothetical protein